MDSIGVSEISIKRYSAELKSEWDAFVDESRNATFLFKRGYMDYHSDRFTDHSLLAYKGGKIIAMLPANDTEGAGGERILVSHSGLTYGGWICGRRHPDGEEMIEIFKALNLYGLERGLRGIEYRPIPWIYADNPSQEDIYALSRCGARKTACKLSAAISLDSNPGFNKRQRRYLAKAEKDTDVRVEEVAETAEFHRLLTECLEERYGVKPVHTSEELALLKGRFPEEIRIFLLRDAEGLQAGVCIFDCATTAHAQYICSTPRAREKGLLSLLFLHLIEDVFAEHRYFDFGTSNEADGSLNAGLYRQKFGLGGSGVVYESYYMEFSAEKSL